jgi:hypothetical protein
LTVPIFSGLGVAAVVGLAALWHHIDFRRTGDPPVFSVRHVFTYGAATFLSAAHDEIWKPPLWQKLCLYGLAGGLAWAVLKLFRKRSAPWLDGPPRRASVFLCGRIAGSVRGAISAAVRLRGDVDEHGRRRR